MDQQRTLVVYTGEFGSTAGVARAIAETLSDQGQSVDLKQIANAGDISGYSAVVLGSAIQYDNWMPAARAFLRENRNALRDLPVAFFFTCLTLSVKSEKAKLQARGYALKLSGLEPKVRPISVGGFAGALNYGKMPPFKRLIAKAILPLLGVQEGDHRDWRAIRAWASALHSGLVRGPAVRTAPAVHA